ncbi:MAG: TetR/AcrR family transcriptional regulator [Acidobacteriota bacterium]|nr:TetR/AcrR family transcriptional regulator [Acidobacteriota bacterium]
MSTVLDAVAERLREYDESRLRIPEICSATGINYGSVYHHFGSREGVIDAAYEMMFSEIIERDISVIREAVVAATSFGDFLAATQRILGTIATGEERRLNRAMRLRIVSASTTRPQLRDLISGSQTRLTAELTRVVELGQARGWIRADVAAHSVAVVLQAVVFGRNLDDLSSDPMPESEWTAFTFQLFALLLTPS